MDRRVFAGLLLVFFGGISSLMLLSVSPTDASSQLGFAVMGVIVYSLTQLVPRRVIRLSVIPGYVVVCILLILTLFLGHNAKGASRWFSIGSVRLQVSEIAKPMLALAVCTYVTHYSLHSHRRLLMYFVLAGAMVFPVLIQPDLGSSLVLAALATGVCLVAVKRMSLLIPWVFLAMIMSVVAWNFVLYPYQKQRLFSFLGTSDQKGSGYNASQAIITVGSGKFWGRGIGHGVQTNLRFLPEHHTDFFFASFAEETGFVGVVLLFGVFACLFGVLLWNIHLLDTFDSMLRIALLSTLLFQAFVHIYMNIGLAPVTGIPLPFLSSGGSSFVSLSLFLGLGMRFHRLASPKSESKSIGFAL